VLHRVLAASAPVIVALLGVQTAAAASAPTVTTGPVTAVAATTATVSGSINPNGSATSWYVEYGTSTSYGSKTPAANAGSGTSGTTVTAPLTGLKPGTNYHYRVVAASSAGTAHGADGLLTTTAAPQVSTGDASNVTTSTATLNGTVNPSSRSTTWYFELGTSTSYGSKTPPANAGSGTVAVPVSAPVAGLHGGRTYHFRMVATSDAGTSRGADRTFVAASVPITVTRPASSVKDTSATLHGAVTPNGQSTSAFFEYGTSTTYGAKSAAKGVGSGTGATSLSIPAGGLSPGTTYHFRLVAANASGTSTGADQTFTTTGAPAVRTGPATGTTYSGATMTASVDSRGHSTTWYFQYGLTPAYGQQTPTRSQSSSSGARSVSEVVGSLTAGTTYHFRIVAANSVGTSYGSDTAFTTAGPAVSVAASATTVILRHAVTLTGKVASGRPNESVAVFAQPYGGGSFAAAATVLTDAGGSWTLVVRPLITTTYKGVWNGSTSTSITVGVRPALSIRALPRGRFATHVAGVHSFAGRTVQLQRHLLNGGWLTISRARLGASSSAVFRPRLRRGRSTLRVAISVNQAGAGYLAGFSRAIAVRRR
jgi:Fibronectin type III domain